MVDREVCRRLQEGEGSVFDLLHRQAGDPGEKGQFCTLGFAISNSQRSPKNRHTFFEVLLDSYHTKVSTIKLVLASIKPMQSLDSLLVAEVCGLDANPLDESRGLRPDTMVLKLHHDHGQILRLIESRSASIDVDHELLPSRSDRGVETLPCLEASAETYGFHSTRSEEELVAADHYALSSSAIWKRGEDQIKSRDDRLDVVCSILSGKET